MWVTMRTSGQVIDTGTMIVMIFAPRRNLFLAELLPAAALSELDIEMPF
jgi:hypothetical protein